MDRNLHVKNSFNKQVKNFKQVPIEEPKLKIMDKKKYQMKDTSYSEVDDQTVRQPSQEEDITGRHW